ncbi:MAG TPA: cyclic nucleotide-binding domain-containing protein, partial [Jiangellaceae bacterium]
MFGGLPDDQLAWLAGNGDLLLFKTGETVFRAGDPADSMIVILEGALELLIGIGGQLVPTFVQYAGEVTGLLPFSRMQHYTGVGRAAGSLRVLRIPKGRFPEMLQRIPALGQRLVSVMADRVREATRVAEQRQKMSALGTLSAGLAHELNNPAAAVRRDAESLQRRL